MLHLNFKESLCAKTQRDILINLKASTNGEVWCGFPVGSHKAYHRYSSSSSQSWL